MDPREIRQAVRDGVQDGIAAAIQQSPARPEPKKHHRESLDIFAKLSICACAVGLVILIASVVLHLVGVDVPTEWVGYITGFISVVVVSCTCKSACENKAKIMRDSEYDQCQCK